MSRTVLGPATVSGRLPAPPSKSYTHRALIVGHLTGRPYRIRRPLVADDTRATARGIARLGSEVERRPLDWIVEPSGKESTGPVTLDCGESGTTLRFLAALAAVSARRVFFRGAPRLGERPMAPLLTALRQLGARVSLPRGSEGLPFEIEGPIHGGRVRVDASESSQFASALLLTLPTLDDGSEIVTVGSPVSRPYLEATLSVLDRHGIHIRRRERGFEVPGGQRYLGSRFDVPGDASSAAYFWAAAAITGGDVRVEGLPGASEWPQADLAMLEVLRALGADVLVSRDQVRVRGEARRPFSVDLTDAPDLFPLVGTVAAVTPGRSEIRGAEQVEFKESDRRAGTQRLVRALGGRVRSAPHRLTIDGTSHPRSFSLSGLTDHRLVMSAAIGALAAPGRSRVGEREAVRKSFPGFWTALRSLTRGDRTS